MKLLSKSNRTKEGKTKGSDTGKRQFPVIPQHREISHGPGMTLFSMKRLDNAVAKAKNNLVSYQNAKGFWAFPLEADVTIPSEYILLQRFLGREMEPGLKDRLGSYLRSKQLPDGGWPLFEAGMANISASVKAYFALKLLGDSPNAPHMIKARQLIMNRGGAARVNVFTRIALALFGQVPWSTAPAMPIEIMLLPRWFFFPARKDFLLVPHGHSSPVDSLRQTDSL